MAFQKFERYDTDEARGRIVCVSMGFLISFHAAKAVHATVTYPPYLKPEMDLCHAG